MYCELPKLGRCCFCMPLRPGLLTFGYINLVHSLMGTFVYSTSAQLYVEWPSFTYENLDAFAGMINDAIYGINVVFSVILIYGAHKKAVRWLKVYYYYTLATFVMMILLTLYFMYVDSYYTVESVAMSTTRWCLYFYLILLVRSFIEELENTSGLTENQLKESVDDEMKKDNTDSPTLPAETV